MQGVRPVPNYACKCLNIRIFSREVTSSHVEHDLDEEYMPVHVGDNGISVIHTQVILKSRLTIASSQPQDTDSRRQWLTVSCLVCHIKAYRIAHQTTIDLEPREGIILPADDWVESEIPYGRNGWINVHIGPSGCMTGDRLTSAMQHSSYSSKFSIILPNAVNPSPAQSSSQYDLSNSPLKAQTLPPLFPPPPFTPSHPVFLHFASVAESSSNQLRAKAEAHIAEFARHQLREVQSMEDDLRKQVTSLWSSFKEGLQSAQMEEQLSSNQYKESSRANLSGINELEIAKRPVVTADYQRPSGISASIPSSGIRRPLEQHGSNLEAVGSHNSSPASATLSASGPPSDISHVSNAERDSTTGGIVVPGSFKRNMDQTKDIATTFRYNQILAQEAAAGTREQAQLEHDIPPVDVLQEMKPDKRTQKLPADPQKDNASAIMERSTDAASPASDPSSRSKGKAVSFHVDKRQLADLGGESDSQDELDMMFDLDESDDGHVAPRKLSAAEAKKLVLPLKEPPEVPRSNRRKPHSVINGGLPESLSSLRPSSLPGPSHMHSLLSETVSLAVPSTSRQKGKAKQVASSDTDQPNEDLPHEAQLKKLVAANTPSHRGAWNKDGKAWKIFEQRQSDRARSGATSPVIEEEEENEISEGLHGPSIVHPSSNWRNFTPNNIASSLPVSFGPPVLRPQPAFDADVTQAAATYRRATYAARNLRRGFDPGPLDFNVDTEDGEEDSRTAQSPDIPVSKSRSREHAWKILEARSKIPSEGMWRSLAN